MNAHSRACLSRGDYNKEEKVCKAINSCFFDNKKGAKAPFRVTIFFYSGSRGLPIRRSNAARACGESSSKALAASRSARSSFSS